MSRMMSPRRGKTPDIHLNLNVRGLQTSATLRINEESARILSQGGEVFRMGLGQSPFPVPGPVVEALRRNAHQKEYLPVKGLGALRDAVAGYHRRRQCVELSGDDVLVGPGTKELMFLLQLVYYGDLVIPTPSWVSYAPQAHIIGRQIRWIPTRKEAGWLMTPEDLERLCAEDPDRPRILILNYPSNPTGGTYNSDELRGLARVARRYRVILLSDEIYGDLHFHGRHVSIARYYPEGTVVSTGLSKWCGAGGWRLGVFLFPPGLRWLLESMAVVASETYTSTSAPIQYAAMTAFQENPGVESYLMHCRRILRVLHRKISTRLQAAEVAVPEAKGAFYLFPDFGRLRKQLKLRGIHSSSDFCRRLLQETGVAILPGEAFGRPPRELTARIAYVDFDGEGALAASERAGPGRDLNGTFFEQHCARVLRAIDLLCEWLHQPPS